MGTAYGVSIAGASSKASMTGSLSSIVHSEDEIAGSYNWDYLLDWGPQYQPLAHVFKEISKLRDDEKDVSAYSSGGDNSRTLQMTSNVANRLGFRSTGGGGVNNSSVSGGGASMHQPV